jgi:hypothetical protein
MRTYFEKREGEWQGRERHSPHPCCTPRASVFERTIPHQNDPSVKTGRSSHCCHIGCFHAWVSLMWYGSFKYVCVLRGRRGNGGRRRETERYLSFFRAAEKMDEDKDWLVGYNPGVQSSLKIDLMHNLNHSSVVCCVKFSADGKYLATGGNKGAQMYLHFSLTHFTLSLLPYPCTLPSISYFCGALPHSLLMTTPIIFSFSFFSLFPSFLSVFYSMIK